MQFHVNKRFVLGLFLDFSAVSCLQSHFAHMSPFSLRLSRFPCFELFSKTIRLAYRKLIFAAVKLDLSLFGMATKLKYEKALNNSVQHHART